MMRLAFFVILITCFLIGGKALALDENRVQYVVFTLLELAEMPQSEGVYTTTKSTFCRFGEFFYPEYDASFLGWRDSYILDALLDLFELTGDRSFLDLFQNKVSRIFSLMEEETWKGFLSTSFSEELLGENRVSEGGSIRVDLGRLDLSPGMRYAFRFWILCPEGEPFSVRIGERLERYQGSPCWKMYFGDFEYQGERAIGVELEGNALIRDVSLRAYQEELAYSGVLTKTILRGMKLGCSFKEPVVEKIECLVNQVMARTEPSDSDSPKMLLYYVPFALTRLYWGDWKSDARVFASVQEFAYQLKEGLFGSDEFLSYLEQTLDFPGVDAVPEFVIECLKRETVFSREDITLLAQFFLNNLCSQAPGVVGTLEEGLRILPGWVLLGLFEKEILSFFENWLETNLSEILTTALQGAVQARLITNLTKFLLVKKFWRESCGEHLDL